MTVTILEMFSVTTLPSMTSCKSSWLSLRQIVTCSLPTVLDPADCPENISKLWKRLHAIAVVSVQRQEQDPRQIAEI